MLELPQVTLIALTDYKLDEHIRAAKEASKEIKWGNVKIIYDEGIKHDVNNWNKKIVYELWKYVDTDFALLFHADGYPINAKCWKDEWLEFDYIGAPWPLPNDEYSYRDPFGNIQRVGNSVSLRSKKLLELPSKIGLPWKSYYGNTNEDGFICVHNRHIFEAYGCKFASFEQALDFGREFDLPEHNGRETFAFHQAT